MSIENFDKLGVFWVNVPRDEYISLLKIMLVDLRMYPYSLWYSPINESFQCHTYWERFDTLKYNENIPQYKATWKDKHLIMGKRIP